MSLCRLRHAWRIETVSTPGRATRRRYCTRTGCTAKKGDRR